MKGNEVDCMLLATQVEGGEGLASRRAVQWRSELAEGLISVGAGTVETVPVEVDAAAVDAALDRLGGRRLVVAAPLGALQLVLARLMRRGELDAVETAVLSATPSSYLRSLGLPSAEVDQLEVAVRGRPRLVGVIKDDSGGLCLDSAEVRPWDGDGRPWWLRAVVDDQPLCDGPALAVAVRRLGPSELEATVELGRRLGRPRRRTLRGRSLQLACDEALITQDGLARERSRTKRTFWSEPTLWSLCLE
jgi:hypothetical protein